MKKILIVFGTRPEAIKMAPLNKVLKESFKVNVCVTAQHREMLDHVLNLFNIVPDYDLDIMKPNQDLFDILNKVLKRLKAILIKENPDLVLVHGDTTTTLAASLASSYLNIPVGHVEAGLRTYDLLSPFPEEINRQLTSRVTRFHFAPTERARRNLLKENIPDKSIYITGNTVIDSLMLLINRAREEDFPKELIKRMPFLDSKGEKKKLILVTGHRRENFGEGFEEICSALKSIASRLPEVEIIYPVHLNPNVQEPVNRILKNTNNIHLLEPLNYLPFLKLMDSCHLILTDSGGIQEEAPSLGKPVLLMRNTSERPEAIEAGTVKIVGSQSDSIFNSTINLFENISEYESMAKAINPYGEGNSSKIIKDILIENL